MAINVGSVLATLDLDTSPFYRGMEASTNQLSTFAQKGTGSNKVIGALQTGIGKVGKVLATAGIGISLAGIAKNVITTGMEFDAQMSRVQAISGATAEEFETLRAAAIQMGADSVFGATDAAQALEYMGMAGWNTEQMLDGLPGIINLAAASGEDLGAVSDIVTDALTAFGLTASDSAHFADVLAAASTSSNTNVGLMGETFKYVAPLAGALGYSAEDCAVAIGLMANSGIKGSQAGTALRGMLTRLSKPTDDVAAAMDKYGISLTDAQGNMLPFNDLVVTMRGVFDGLSEAQQTELAATLAGQEGMSGLLAIVNASEEDYQKLTKAVQECDGATQTMADKMLDNLKGDVEGFNGALEGLALKLSDLITPALRTVVGWGTKAVDWLSGMTDKLKGATDASGLFQGALNGLENINWESLMGTVGKVATSLLTNLTNSITGKADMALKIAGAIVTCVSQVDWASVASGLGTIAKGLVDNLGSAIPRLTDSAAGLMTAIVNGIGNINWGSIGTSLAGVATSLLDGILNNLPAMVEGAGKLVEKIGEGIAAAAGALGTVAGKLVEGIAKYITSPETWGKLIGAGAKIIEGIGVGLARTAVNIADSLLPQSFKDWAEEIRLGINGLHQTANGTVMGGGGGSFADVGGNVSRQISTGAQENWDLDSFITDALGETKNLLQNSAVDWGKVFGQAIPDGATAGLENGMYVLRSKTGEVIKLVSAVDAKADVEAGNKDAAKAGVDAMSGELNTGETAVGEAAQGLSDTVTETMEPLPGLMQSVSETGVSDMATGILNKKDEVTAATLSVSDEAVNTALKTMSVAQGVTIGEGFGGGIMTGVQNKNGPLSSTARSTASGGVNAVRSAMSSGIGYSIGQGMIQGVINGVASMSSSLANRMRAVASAAVNAFRNKLQMHSPSRLLMADGALIPTSYAMGVEGNKKTFIRSMIDLAGAVQDAWPGVDLGGNMPRKPNIGGFFNAATDGGLTFNFYGDMTVREEADIQRISAELRDEFVEELRGRGY